MDIVLIDAFSTLKDRYAPRFEVYVAKAPRTPPSHVSEAILDPETATRLEKQRLDGSLFKVTGNIRGMRPGLNQLVPLAGPWGEKSGQRTDDIISVQFKEDVSAGMLLAAVSLEVLNVYDSERRYYRYTDIPPHLGSSQSGVYPLLDYGDTVAVRFGYGSDLDWVFDGTITELSVSFPEGGESRVTVTAVDKRERLRSRKAVSRKSFARLSEAKIVAALASEVGLRVAAPVELTLPPEPPPAAQPPGSAAVATSAASAAASTGAASVAAASGGFSLTASGGALGQVRAGGAASAQLTPGVGLSTSGSLTFGAGGATATTLSNQVNTSGTRATQTEPVNKVKSSDQDALTYITDRIKKAALELRCFGNTLFVLKPADSATTALRYVYRQGLSSFTPELRGQGVSTRVRVVARNSRGHQDNSPAKQKIEVEVGSEDLRKAGLVASADALTVLEKIAAANQVGDKIDVVTDYPAATEAEAKRIALGVLKRNVDEAFKASGAVVGDPRIRARTTLKIEGVGRFDGFYYVTSATHILGSNGYQTSFNVRRTVALAEEGAASGAAPVSLGAQLLEGAAALVKVRVR
jgi:hypothetical protein